MKELYTAIESWMDSHLDGWSTKEKVAALVGAILALRPRVVMEIGIWSGRSFIPMAMAMKHIKSAGVAIGIDPWETQASVVGLEGDHLDWWSKVDHERIYKDFQKSIAETGVGPWIQVMRCRSSEYKIKGDLVIDLLHVDGNHGEEASVYDVNTFAPRVRPGGLLYFDDVSWASKASGLIPQLGFEPLFTMDTGAMYQRLCT